MRILTAAAVAAAALVVLAPSASAGPGTRAVRQANDTIGDMLRKRVDPGSAEEQKLRDAVTRRVRDFLDVTELGKRSLRDHWDAMPKATRDELMALLRSLIEDKYVEGLRANVDYAVGYLGEKKAGAHVRVSTEIRAKRRGRPYTISVDYILRRDGNQWRAFDVVTDGVGLVENYRAQFNKIIAKEGVDGLLKRMRARAGRAPGASG